MPGLKNYVTLCVIFVPVMVWCSNLNRVLRHYEFISPERIKRNIVKRSLRDVPAILDRDRVEVVSLDTASGGLLNLRLIPDRSLITNDFTTVLVDAKGTERKLSPSIVQYYRGNVVDEPESDVRASLEPDGSLLASIRLPNETYYVEPGWLHGENASLFYRASDVILDLKYDMGGGRRNLLSSADVSSMFHEFVKRKRRATDTSTGDPAVHQLQLNRCALKLVADYRFYRQFSQPDDDGAGAVRYLINLIGRVNHIFEQTVWRDFDNSPGFTNVSFVIRTIRVHTEYSEGHPFEEHYNTLESGKWNASKLLLRFSELEGTPPVDVAGGPNVCLAHLFTYRSFEGGILG